MWPPADMPDFRCVAGPFEHPAGTLANELLYGDNLFGTRQ